MTLSYLQFDIFTVVNVLSSRSYVTPNEPDSGLCGEVPNDAMHLFRDATPGESDLPWTGMIFGIAVSSIWYWCSDQVFVKLDFQIILNLFYFFIIIMSTVSTNLVIFDLNLKLSRQDNSRG